MIDAPYGLRPDGKPRKRPIATCSFCSLAAGNSLGVKVLRYPLLRHIDKAGRHTSVCIGSISLCDECAVTRGNVKPEYRR